MLITLNGQKLTSNVRTDCLDNILDDLRGVCPADEIIVAVRLDGVLLGAEAICERLSQPLDAGCQLDVETGPRARIVADALAAAADEISAAADEQRWAAEQADAGDVGQALKSVSAVAQVLQGCQSALIQSAELLQCDLRECEVDGAPISKHLVELTQTLAELRDALAARDNVLLGDLLRGEVADRCGRWGDRLRTLATQIASGAIPVHA